MSGPFYGKHPLPNVTYLETYEFEGFQYDLYLREVPFTDRVRPTLPAWEYADVDARYGPDPTYDWIMGSVSQVALYLEMDPLPPLARAARVAVDRGLLPKEALTSALIPTPA